DVFRKFDGRLLAADEHPLLLEGAWPFDKLVMMSFPDEAAFNAFASSPEYLGYQGIARQARKRPCFWSRDSCRPDEVTNRARRRARRARARRRDRDDSKRAARSNAAHGVDAGRHGRSGDAAAQRNRLSLPPTDAGPHRTSPPA